MAITILNATTTTFTLNGIEYQKNFQSIVNGDNIKITNVYDSKQVLVDSTIYSDFIVDGNTYASATLLQGALVDILFDSYYIEFDNRITTTENDIEALYAGQTGGLKSFTTLALLQAYPTPNINDSYKVTNDGTSSNNGYYHWVSGTTYVKDADLVNSGTFDATNNIISATQKSTADWSKIGINYNPFFNQQVSYSNNFRNNIYSNFKVIYSSEGFKGRKLFISQFNWEPLGATSYTTFIQVSENVYGTDYSICHSGNHIIQKTETGIYDVILTPTPITTHPDGLKLTIVVSLDLNSIQKTSNYYFPSQDSITPSFNECGILPIDKGDVPLFTDLDKKASSIDVNRNFSNDSRVVGEFANVDNLIEGSVIKTDYLYYTDINIGVTDFINVNEGDVIEYNGYMTGLDNLKIIGYNDGIPVENYLFNGGGLVTKGEFTVGVGVNQIKACCYLTYKDEFSLINLNAKSSELVSYETGKTTIGGNYKCYKNQILAQKSDLVEGQTIDYGGTIFNESSYGLTNHIQIIPEAEIQFIGVLQNYNSICGFDADGNFVEAYVRTLNTQPLTYAGKFTPSKNVRSIRASALYLQPFSMYYTKSVRETFERETFRDFLIDDLKNQTLVGSVNLKSINTLPIFKDIIKLNKNGINPYISVIGKESKSLYSKPIFKEYRDLIADDTAQNLNFFNITSDGVMLIGAGSKLYKSTDKFLSNSLIQDFTTANGFETGNVINCFEISDGSIFVNFQLSEARRIATGKEIYIYKGTVNGDTWTFSTTPVLTLDYYGAGTFSLIGSDWGQSSSDNTVVLSDYGTQGFAGKAWISQDYGETFTKIFDLYDGSLLPDFDIPNGHVHSSNYDAYYNRIWLCTGDGLNNSYTFWSDDLGVTWNGTKIAYDGLTYNQFVTIRSYKDFVLFQTDNLRNGVWRYNRNNKNTSPILEWACDIYDYSNANELDKLSYTGNGITRWSNESPIISTFGDHGYEIGVKGVIVATFDGFNFYELYRDTTGGLLTSSIAFEDDEFMYISNIIPHKMMVFKKAKFIE
jgi:hypothetical protein